MEISLVVPNRNNLKYFKWMYDSVRKNQGEHVVWICSAADSCTDGTVEYYEELSKKDPYFKYIVNDTGVRFGHTILYDRIIKTLVNSTFAMIWHCDMYLAPGALDVVSKKIHSNKIVSLTRIEPPLHPPGPEKIIAQFGLDVEEFDEAGFLSFIKQLNSRERTLENTNGIFAPWAFPVDKFKEIHGHNPIFWPQSKEDSDIFNRFKLHGVEFEQTFEGFVYHMTCRGNRRNTLDGATNIYTDNTEWQRHNVVSGRNFCRIWGTTVLHDQVLHPITMPRYRTEFVLKNCDLQMLYNLEPFADIVYVDSSIIDDYIASEQKNTLFDLRKKLKPITELQWVEDIRVYLDLKNATRDDINYMLSLPMIFSASDLQEHETYQIGNLKIEVRKLKTYDMELIDSRSPFLTERYLPREYFNGDTIPEEVLELLS